MLDNSIWYKMLAMENITANMKNRFSNIAMTFPSFTTTKLNSARTFSYLIATVYVITEDAISPTNIVRILANFFMITHFHSMY